MKYLLVSVIALFSLPSSFAQAAGGGSTELVDGRLKIQIHLPSSESKGSFQLRNILEKAGFKSGDGFGNDPGFVETHGALAPLEIYNYLYADGKYAFTIFLPVSDKALFVSFDEKGFISFTGEAAKKLFEVLKANVPRDDLQNIEQYKISDSSYCDKTLLEPAAYRCWIDR